MQQALGPNLRPIRPVMNPPEQLRIRLLERYFTLARMLFEEQGYHTQSHTPSSPDYIPFEVTVDDVLTGRMQG